MAAKSRFALRYTDAKGQEKEEVFGGRGSFTKAGIGRAAELKTAGVSAIQMVRQVQQPNGTWRDGKPFILPTV